MISAMQYARLLPGLPGLLLVASLACAESTCGPSGGPPSIHNSGHVVSVAELRIPEKAWAHLYKASAAVTAEQFESEADKALAITPQFAQVYLLRASRQVSAGQSELALRSIAEARRIDPNTPWASVIAAGALLPLHRFDEAVAELERARGQELGSWQWRFQLARVETAKGDAEAALHWSALAMTAAPVKCAEVHLLRADALLIAGHKREALPEMETYLALGGIPTTRNSVIRAMARVRADLQAQAPPEMRQPDSDAELVAGVPESKGP